MSGTYQQSADEIWRGGFAARAPGKAGPWSWPVSLAFIGGLSLLGWSAAVWGLVRLLGA